jgi:hypothetical protein
MLLTQHSTFGPFLCEAEGEEEVVITETSVGVGMGGGPASPIHPGGTSVKEF